MQLILTEETLTQKHLEDWWKSYRKHDVDDHSRAEYHGALVRSAIEAGWLDAVAVEKVDEMSPKAVTKLALEIDALYREVTTVDPN